MHIDRYTALQSLVLNVYFLVWYAPFFQNTFIAIWFSRRCQWLEKGNTFVSIILYARITKCVENQNNYLGFGFGFTTLDWNSL